MISKRVTLLSFSYSSEAQIIKGRIEAEGIAVFLSNEYIVDTDPLISNAVGGVKLQVWKSDKTKAEAVLASVSEYSVDNQGAPLVCPNCKEEKIRYYTSITDFHSFLSFLVCIFFVVLPLSVSYKYRCENCKRKFNTL